MTDLTASSEGGVLETHPWGQIRWLVSAALEPGATVTVGVCRIDPGRSNPLHRHLNCDEVLVVTSGRCRKQVGENFMELGPGDSVRIPRGVAHQAATLGDQPLVCVICYDTPRREIELL